ncbi:DUF6131 family protein [Streptomyces sp. NPDC057474]
MSACSKTPALVVVGIILRTLGSVGHVVGGRRHYW